MNKDHLHLEELVKRSYKNLGLSALAIVLNATVLAWLVYGYVDTQLLVNWYMLITVISALRFLSAHYYTKLREEFSLVHLKWIFCVGLVASTLTFGMVPFLFFVQISPLHQALLIMIFAGLSAGGISSLSSLRQGVKVFLVLFLVPLIIKLLLEGTPIYNAMAFLVLLYLLMLLRISKEFHEHYIDILRSRRMYEEERDKLLISQERFEAVFKQAPIGIMIYDNESIIREINQEFIDFLEAPREYLIGLDLHSIPDKRVLPSLEAALENNEGFYEGEYKTKLKEKSLWITMSTSPLRDFNQNVMGGIAIISDITERMMTQLQFEYQANYDALTDIPNRSTLLERMKQELIRYRRHDVIFGVMFLDLDNFKNINDSLGHAVGDKLLVETAQRLKSVIRSEDTVARIGGDEFVVLLPDLEKEEHLAATNAEHAAQKVHDTMAKPFEIDGYKLSVSSSIGISLVNAINDSAEEVLKFADIAMYQAKKEGKNTTRFYQEKMDRWIKRRLELENGLHRAIENEELSIHYQPIVEFSSAKLVGAEALLRWNSKSFGSISPEEFIPIAEESGIILKIGHWVFENAVKQFVTWQREFPHLKEFKKISINISVHQFNHIDFVENVKQIIEKHGINPAHIELELVESIIVKDIEIVRNKMQKLRDLGIGISIDDFGTGYSSLSYLKKLPFTTLKIDRSFVQDIQHDADDKELVSTILTIAKNFNLDVVAEGVETIEQYQFLHEKMCGYLQGYYCSKPVDCDSFDSFLKEHDGVCTVLSSDLKVQKV